MTIQEIKYLKETEDKVELKLAQTQFNYNSGRKSLLGYVVALANEGGGKIILGVKENQSPPHEIIGSEAWNGKEGKLEQDIYRDKQIRITTEVIYDGNKRVLILHVPPRPVGKFLTFEDVSLMRVGEDLLPMSQRLMFSILSEQEPDFSAKICEGLKVDDLDDQALRLMKEKYLEKQRNPSLATLKTNQILSDLNLLKGGKLTFAALILLGSKECIRNFLPQSSVTIEFREAETQIERDANEEIQESLFTGIEKIWSFINQPLSNPIRHYQQGPYIFDVQRFNEEVIREAILNAIAHRSYQFGSSVVVRQFPFKIVITNPGGFPFGVTKDNILTIASHPRNKLLMETLEKTGLVERSSQGVDKMFLISLSESKAAPDYSASDDYQVELSLDVRARDYDFAVFINEIQKSRKAKDKLGVWDVITLDKIRQGIAEDLDEYYVSRLYESGLIRKSGGTTSTKYILGDKYFEIANVPAEVGGFRVADLEVVCSVFENNPATKIGNFVEAFDKQLSRSQVKYLIDKLEGKIIQREGKGKGTIYKLIKDIAGSRNLFEKVKEILDEKMKSR